MKPTCSDRPIWDVWLAAFHAPTLAIADELGVFTALAARPANADELAAALQVEPRATESMLGLLAALGFLGRAGAAFELTEVARTYLLPESEYYWGGFLRRIRTIPIDCDRLVEALRRGRAAQDARVSGSLWRAPQPPAEALVGFTHAMHSHSFALARRVVASFGLTSASVFLDVAGGSGSYSIAAALELPGLRATVLDLPAVCEVTRAYAAKHGVGDRVTAIAGDMFGDAAWPTGATDLFFSDIFHDWDDERCTFLARRAYEALAPGGRILVHEMTLDETKDGPLNAIAYSMVMVFVTEGRQRTVEELFAILRNAGFAEPDQTTTGEGYRLISARR
jgi:precorrin-6B methylase 2